MPKHFLTLLIAVILTMPLLVSQSVKAAPMFDIMVLMDSSGSIDNDDFITQNEIVQHLFDSFTIGAAATRFGIVSFSTSAQLTIGLSDNASNLSNALNNAFQQYGQTNHAAALAAAQQELDVNGRGGVGVTNVVILLTDGDANVGSSPTAAAIANADQLKGDGAYLFTLGIGSQVDLDDLQSYSSNPAAEFAFAASDFDSGFAAMDDIIYQINQLGSAASVDAPAPLYLLMIGLMGMILAQANVQFRKRANAIAALVQ